MVASPRFAISPKNKQSSALATNISISISISIINKHQHLEVGDCLLYEEDDKEANANGQLSRNDHNDAFHWRWR